MPGFPERSVHRCPVRGKHPHLFRVVPRSSSDRREHHPRGKQPQHSSRLHVCEPPYVLRSARGRGVFRLRAAGGGECREGRRTVDSSTSTTLLTQARCEIPVVRTTGALSLVL